MYEIASDMKENIINIQKMKSFFCNLIYFYFEIFHNCVNHFKIINQNLKYIMIKLFTDLEYFPKYMHNIKDYQYHVFNIQIDRIVELLNIFFIIYYLITLLHNIINMQEKYFVIFAQISIVM